MSRNDESESEMIFLEEGDEFPKLGPRKVELDVSLHGLDLPENSVTSLQTEIKKAIKEEMERNEQGQSEISEMRNASHNYDRAPITISLHGLNLPKNSVLRLESEIMEIISASDAKNVIQTKSGVGESEKSTCVCAGTSPAGKKLSLVNPLPRPAPQPFRIGLINNNTHDGVMLEILNPDYNIPLNEVVVSLESARDITWEKRLETFNVCTGYRSFLLTRDAFHGGLVYINRAYKSNCYSGTDTLTLSKMTAFGFIGHIFYFDISQFWQNFGGRRLHFTWIVD